jgi:hypothetical protein
VSFIRRHFVLILSVNILLDIALLLAFFPLQFESREEIFEIPSGTWANRSAGNKVEILPQQIYLALGVRDVLVLRNLDTVPQIFGPTLIMPNQSFKLPFELASDYQFACTAHASGQMTIVVDPEPTPGLQRLQWRFKTAARWLLTKF